MLLQPAEHQSQTSRAWLWLDGGDNKSELHENGGTNGGRDTHSSDSHRKAVDPEDASALHWLIGERETPHLGHGSPTAQLNQRIDTGDTRALCCGIGGSSCGSSSSSSSILQMDGLLQSLCGLQACNKAAVPPSVPSAPSSEDVNKPCGSKTAHADLPSPPRPADS